MMRFNRPQPAAGFAMMVRAVDVADGAVPPPATRVFGAGEVQRCSPSAVGGCWR